jgi:hypothetical protein
MNNNTPKKKLDEDMCRNQMRIESKLQARRMRNIRKNGDFLLANSTDNIFLLFFSTAVITTTVSVLL